FSATQFALLSSLVGITRALMGPLAGVMVDAFGWRDFFFLTVLAAAPGLFLLSRFAPWGVEPKLEAAAELTEPQNPWPRGALWGIGASTFVSASALGFFAQLFVAAAKQWREHQSVSLGNLLGKTQALDVASAVAFGAIIALAVAAYLAARGRRT